MSKEEVLSVLYGKETVEVYREFQKIEKNIDESDSIYSYFEDIKQMLLDERSAVRVRVFKIICRLAKYDKENKIDRIIDILLSELDDDKPTAIRQCLAATHILLNYKPELTSIIKDKLNKLDYTKYNENMSPLIKKDIEGLLKKV